MAQKNFFQDHCLVNSKNKNQPEALKLIRTGDKGDRLAKNTTEKVNGFFQRGNEDINIFSRVVEIEASTSG